MAEPVSLATSITGLILFSQKICQFASDLRQASEESNRIKDNVTNASAVLEQLQDLTRESGPGSEGISDATIQSLGSPGGPLQQLKSILDRLEGKLKKASGLKKARKTIAWPFQKGEVRDLLIQIVEIKSTLELALLKAGIGLSKAIKADTNELNDKLNIACRGIDEVQRAQEVQNASIQGEQRHAILSWLSPLDFAAQQLDCIRRCTKNTGQWFLRSSKFREWKDGSEKTLFCHGIPGSGKTILASVAIDHLKGSITEQSVRVVYIYCSYRNRTQQTLENLLGSTWKQLIQGLPTIPAALTELYKKHQHNGTYLNVDALTNGLTASLHESPRLFIVIDALDECADDVRNPLIKIFRHLQDHHSVKLLCLSRPIRIIEKEVSSCLQLEIRATDGDVRMYLDERMAEQMGRLAPCVQSSLELQNLIKGKIIGATDGMFLLAELYFGLLHDKRTVRAIRNYLDNLPAGKDALNKAYKDTLERINAQNQGLREIAENVLSWITYAERELSVLELQAALAVKPGDTELDDENLLEPEEMINYCAGLVTIDEESQVVRLIHHTTRDYLRGAKCFPNAQKTIATACLTYLLFEAIAKPFEYWEAYHQLRAENVLFEYAAKHLGNHIGEELDQSMEVLVMDFFRSSSQLLNSWRCMNNSIWTLAPHGIHVCAWFGLVNLSHSLLQSYQRDKTAIAGMQDHYENTPLFYAASRGHGALVRYLAERNDVDADPRNEEGDTPLSAAAEMGYEGIVRYLANRNDVNTDSKDVVNETPLWKAAKNGHENVVRYLADRDDVDADSKSNDGNTPLSQATENGHESVVRYLADRDDVDTDSKDQYERTPLLKAALRGDESMVGYLAGRDDVDADSKNDEGKTPLTEAASWGHKGIAQYLAYRNNVDADSKDIWGRTPLSKASDSRHESIVRYLAGRNDVGKESKIETLADVAAYGQWNTVKLLLELANIDEEVEGRAMNRALIQAATLSKFDVVKYLAQRNDISLESKGQALVRAAETNQLENTKYLATRGDISVEYKWEALKRAERNVSRFLSKNMVWHKERSQEIAEYIRNLFGDPPPTWQPPLLVDEDLSSKPQAMKMGNRQPIIEKLWFDKI